MLGVPKRYDQRGAPARQAAAKAGLTKRAACHAFRHFFASGLLEGGYDIRTVHELLGHSDVKTTMIYTHVLNRGPAGVSSACYTDRKRELHVLCGSV